MSLVYQVNDNPTQSMLIQSIIPAKIYEKDLRVKLEGTEFIPR